MYNLNLHDNEELIEIFEEAWIAQGNNEKTTTIALTNQRLLFLEYDNEDPNEILRIGRGIDYVRYKEIYYSLNLSDIKDIIKSDTYSIILKNNTSFEIDNEDLYKMIDKEIKR